MQILVVQPDATVPLLRLEQPWTDAGIDLRSVRPYAGDPVPASPAEVGADALVVLGGEMAPDDDAAYPWLAEVRALQRRAHEDGVPQLGICLGGQLLGYALGGAVGRGASGREAGVVDVRLTDAAADDALLGGLPDPLPMPSMHGDEVSALPEGAVLLGGTDRYPHQAFRCGDTSWGLQFHPEVTPEVFARWAAGYGMDAEGAELAGRDAEVHALTLQVAARFAAVVRRTAAAAATAAATTATTATSA